MAICFFFIKWIPLSNVCTQAMLLIDVRLETSGRKNNLTACNSCWVLCVKEKSFPDTKTSHSFRHLCSLKSDSRQPQTNFTDTVHVNLFKVKKWSLRNISLHAGRSILHCNTFCFKTNVSWVSCILQLPFSACGKYDLHLQISSALIVLCCKRNLDTR